MLFEGATVIGAGVDARDMMGKTSPVFSFRGSKLRLDLRSLLDFADLRAAQAAGRLVQLDIVDRQQAKECAVLAADDLELHARGDAVGAADGNLGIGDAAD